MLHFSAARLKHVARATLENGGFVLVYCHVPCGGDVGLDGGDKVEKHPVLNRVLINAFLGFSSEHGRLESDFLFCV